MRKENFIVDYDISFDKIFISTFYVIVKLYALSKHSFADGSKSV